MNGKGIGIIIVFIGIAIFAIAFIFIAVESSALESAIAVALLVIASLGSLIFRPIRDELESAMEGIFIDDSVHRICVYGRAGSGKSTLIETAFTLTDPEKVRKSTKLFDYYKFKIQTGLKNFADVAIADYKGQNPSQVILQGPTEFFGKKNSRMINSLILIVDMVPRKADDEIPWDDKRLLDWLKNDKTVDKIESRVQEHYDYINEATLELLFSSLYSPRLTSVRFVVNKLDLIEKLIDDGYLSVGSLKDAEAYALSSFNTMQRNITRACNQLNINDFSISTICSKDIGDLRPLVADIIRTGS